MITYEVDILCNYITVYYAAVHRHGILLYELGYFFLHSHHVFMPNCHQSSLYVCVPWSWEGGTLPLEFLFWFLFGATGIYKSFWVCSTHDWGTCSIPRQSSIKEECIAQWAKPSVLLWVTWVQFLLQGTGTVRIWCFYCVVWISCTATSYIQLFPDIFDFFSSCYSS